MTDEPFFPKPEGPVTHAIVPKQAEPKNGDAPAKETPPPAGADGFAQETTFVVDLTTPGSVIVEEPFISNDGVNQINVGFAGATAVQMFPGADIGLPTVFIDDDVRLCDFIAPASGRVIGLLIMTNQNPTGVSKFDFGIYDGNASVLKAHTGSVSPVALPNLPAWQQWNFITPTNLIQGTKYKFGYLANIDTGNWLPLPVTQVSPVRVAYLGGINTVLQYARKVTQARIAGTGWTQLANDPGLAGAVAADADTPWTMLVYG